MRFVQNDNSFRHSYIIIKTNTLKSIGIIYYGQSYKLIREAEVNI
jgi:hypothetical protein